MLRTGPAMQVKLADGSVITSHTVCTVSILVGTSIRMTVNCRVLPTLSHDLIFGMQWLTQHNPQIDFHAYTVVFPTQEATPIHCIPTTRVANVKLTSMQGITKAVRRGATAWFATLSPAAGAAEAGEGDAPRTKASSDDTSRWDKLCQEFPEVFKEPGKPPDRPISHAIDLYAGSKPSH